MLVQSESKGESGEQRSLSRDGLAEARDRVERGFGVRGSYPYVCSAQRAACSVQRLPTLSCYCLPMPKGSEG